MQYPYDMTNRYNAGMYDTNAYINYMQAQQRINQLQPQIPQPMQTPIQNEKFFKTLPVTSLDEATAAMISSDGSLNIYVDTQHDRIYTKQLTNNGLAELKVYTLSKENEPKENVVEYVTKGDYNALLERVNKLQEKLNTLGGKHNESNGNNANIQPTKKQS